MASTPAEASHTMRESGCPFSNERMPSLTCSLSSATRIRFEPLYLYFRGCGRGLKILRRSRLSVFSFQIGNRGRGAVRFSRSTHPRCTHNTHSPVGRPDCPAHWNGASWRSVWRPTELKSREFVQAIAMSDNDLPTTTEAVHRLKQEIDCLAKTKKGSQTGNLRRNDDCRSERTRPTLDTYLRACTTTQNPGESQ